MFLLINDVLVLCFLGSIANDGIRIGRLPKKDFGAMAMIIRSLQDVGVRG